MMSQLKLLLFFICSRLCKHRKCFHGVKLRRDYSLALVIRIERVLQDKCCRQQSCLSFFVCYRPLKAQEVLSGRHQTKNAPAKRRGQHLSCDPGGIQTPDFQNRNLTFYSAELRGRQSKQKYLKIGEGQIISGQINVNLVKRFIYTDNKLNKSLAVYVIVLASLQKG
jgi:hypothetical protein